MSLSAASAGLVERDAYLTQLDASLAADAGRLVLVAGEAGVGKTALVGAFCAGLDPRTRVLTDACDGMRTPRALGPLVDIAAQTGGELGEAVEREQPAGCFAALAEELDDARPTVVVIEDVQWADEATLDVLLMLGRRAERVRALVIVTYRDDELTADHPLRRVIGGLGRNAGVDRISLPGLSPEAVGALAEPSGIDGAALYATTGGNSFFVTEVLEAGAGVIPETARDAVLARAAHASPGARRVLDAVAVVPQLVEVWLLEALLGADLAHLDECLDSGMLVARESAARSRPPPPSPSPKRARGARWVVGELAVWRRRAGVVDDLAPEEADGPYALSRAGDAAAAWRKLRCPYEAALALADADDVELRRQALDELQAIEAGPAAAVVAGGLRELGVRGIPRGPRPQTRENPAGLTAREIQVRQLLAEGLRNARIAERLVLSTKTVGHHVSAILRKLDADSRGEAVAAADRLGILPPR